MHSRNLNIFRNFASQTIETAKHGRRSTDAETDYRNNIFYHRDLVTIRAPSSKQMPKPKQPECVRFGCVYSDHMFEIDFDGNSWNVPTISPLHKFSLHPGSKVFHYAVELFEGMKAYRGADGKIRLFRPEMNMKRMRRTAERSALPDFCGDELLKIIKELVLLDRNWIPNVIGTSLYIRPAMMGTDQMLGVSRSATAKLFVVTGPVGKYFASETNTVSLLADSKYVRSFPGGVGAYKMGCNYAPTIMIADEALAKGCQQVLWLYGPDEHITEVGTMNIFHFWTNEQGEEELVTPPLDDGIILPGITRDSLLHITREWNEFKVSERYVGMAEICRALKEKRLHAMFGSGTACVIAPIGRIMFRGKGSENLVELLIPTLESKPCLMKRLNDAIIGIQNGLIERHDWVTELE